jgi:indole-3-glycerol phosphate synthase
MRKPPDILQRILTHKTAEVVARSEKVSMRTLSHRVANAPPVRNFVEAIDTRLRVHQAAIIAEIKKASPSKGVLRQDFDPVLIAKDYECNGATCLSILTDEAFFQGADSYLQQVRANSMLPILRKDFIIDAYQVYESRVLGADCILLIVAALGDALLQDLAGLAEHLGMDILIEVHNREELERALPLNLTLIGINNRDLHTFETRLDTTLTLLQYIPIMRRHIVVSESGIKTPQDVTLLRQAGVHAFLVGEALMIADEPGAALADLFN